MKPLLLFSASILVLFSACQPNLKWEGEKVYSNATSRIYVEGLGIDDSVDILTPSAFRITKAISNDGNGGSGSYQVNESIEAMVFQAVAGNYGYAPLGTIVVDTNLSGPAVAAGATDSIRFQLNQVLPCGLYKETLTIDPANSVAEGNEGDNDTVHYFFVPSSQNFGLMKTEIVTGIFHKDGQVNTTQFTITAGIDSVRYAHFSFVATEGSKAFTVPPPPVTVMPGAPLTINMFVEGKGHTFSSGFEPTVTGKVTAISADGCIIRQESAKVFVEHE
jgi:hypothetical protein